jgi:hypothetical protein
MVGLIRLRFALARRAPSLKTEEKPAELGRLAICGRRAEERLRYIVAYITIVCRQAFTAVLAARKTGIIR